MKSMWLTTDVHYLIYRKRYFRAGHGSNRAAPRESPWEFQEGEASQVDRASSFVRA